MECLHEASCSIGLACHWKLCTWAVAHTCTVLVCCFHILFRMQLHACDAHTHDPSPCHCACGTHIPSAMATQSHTHIQAAALCKHHCSGTCLHCLQNAPCCWGRALTRHVTACACNMSAPCSNCYVLMCLCVPVQETLQELGLLDMFPYLTQGLVVGKLDLVTNNPSERARLFIHACACTPTPTAQTKLCLCATASGLRFAVHSALLH